MEDGYVARVISKELDDEEYRRAFGGEMVKLDFAVALVEARKLHHLTQRQLAEKAGVSQAYIAKLESGEANPTIGHLGSILAAIWLRARFQIGPLASQPPAGGANSDSQRGTPTSGRRPMIEPKYHRTGHPSKAATSWVPHRRGITGGASNRFMLSASREPSRS